MSTMVDTPVPPPLPKRPLRLVRPRRAADDLFQAQVENQRLRHELEIATDTINVLRQQYSERATGPHEDTLPGVGASPKSVRAFQQRRRSREAPRRRVWVPIAAALLGLAATAAGMRYPGLMGPIKDVAQALTKALQ